jgi:hypothetical protein
MLAGVTGQLVSATAARNLLKTIPGAEDAPPSFVRALDLWSDRRESSLGPSASVRAIADVAVIPLLKCLGYGIAQRWDNALHVILHAAASTTSVPVIVTGWGEPLERVWRAAVLDGVQADARWCFCCNGLTMRVIDAHQTWTRHFLEFDLALLAHEDGCRTLFWSMLRADAMAAREPLLDQAAELSARHGLSVCDALGKGVLAALASLCKALAAPRQEHAPQALFEQSLTVLYRVLFLLFAEARGLVPMWHPVYRERYTIESIVTTLLSGGRYRGIWHAVVAISRLAHAGCSAGALKVTPFNGRLFAPGHSAAFERTRIDDEVMAGAVLAISTANVPRIGRVRISYSDLDVEQLGAVYERVLEYEPAFSSAAVLTRTRDLRRSSGSFYTPRSVTGFLVRRTLEPLVRVRNADEILNLRILDPAMGSGAFLVETCRYLAAIAEDRLIAEGRWHPGDITSEDRAGLRREIAQRCLFGVDLNPMAVQLARLSLWLATLAADKPLTFLDHHLVAGDSLVGATPEDLTRQPSRDRLKGRRPQPLPLFPEGALTPVLENAVRTRVRLALDADDSPAIVAAKDKTLGALNAADAPLGRWTRALSLWCAGWFWPDGDPPPRAAFHDLCDHLLRGRAMLSDQTARRLLETSDVLAARHTFLHWPLAFPEIFCDECGHPLPSPGFDAIVGNPPWDMVRGDSGEADVRLDRRLEAARYTDFVREAGIYRVEGRAHVNRYQLFVERALQLARRGGRIGLVLPSGIAADAGTAPLRRHLFDRADVDTMTGLDNRGGIFPIHRSLRFVLLTATVGTPTRAIACRFGITEPAVLDEIGDTERRLILTRQLLGRVSGADDLGIPEVASEHDLRILERVSAQTPWLGAADGWSVRFGRELNATDDKDGFVPFTGRRGARPVLEGKNIEPFRTLLDHCRYELRRGFEPARVARRARIAYRDIASATNRLTLIAAVIPAHVVTTHTLFCLKTPLGADGQQVLCALMNSFVANYLVRLRVNTHVTVALISRLPVPLVKPGVPAFHRLATLSRHLAQASEPIEPSAAYAELQARVAHLYRISESAFEHILGTFPLVSAETRREALIQFRHLQ